MFLLKPELVEGCSSRHPKLDLGSLGWFKPALATCETLRQAQGDVFSHST